jgi:hypothetical protein
MVRLMKQTPAIRVAGYTGFILTLAYLFWFLRTVDLSLIYYWQQTIPFPFADYLPAPGGVSDFLGERFVEFLIRPMPGAMGVALLVAIVFFSLHLVFRRVKESPLFFILLLASLIPFVMLFAHYRLPAGLVMSLATGLLLAALHGLYAPRNLAAGSAYNFITAIIVFLVAGAAGLFILLQAIIIRAVLSKRYLELVTAIPLLIVPVLYMPLDLSFTLKHAYLGSFMISKYNELPLILYFSLFSPLLFLLLYAWLDYLLSRVTLKRSMLISGPGIILVMAALFFSSRAAVNEQERDNFKIYQASFEKEWGKVIELTKGQTQINQLVQYEVNKALYHTGQLLDNLFQYPQQFAEKGLFLEGNASSRIAIHMISFYYDMGYANEARHWATEAQIGLMRHPIVLKTLVMTYTAIGNNAAALKFLRVLSGSGLYREWCDQVRGMIETNTAGDNWEIRNFRSNNPEVDFFAQTSNPTTKLNAFYMNNPENQMAFEFLIASYLLQHKVGNVAVQLPTFRKFGYGRLPRAVEEAMLIYLTRSPEKKLPLADYRVNQRTWEEFQDFSRLMSSTKDRDERIIKVSKYRNTYWYYITLSSPYATKD